MFPRDYDYFENRYYSLSRRFLYTLGMWPFQSKREKIFRICTVTFLQVPLILYEFSQIFMSDFEMELIFGIVQLLLPALCFMCCYYSLVINLVKVQMFRSHMKFDCHQISNEKELHVMESYANQSKWCTIIITFFVYSYGVLMTSPSILNIILYFLGLLDDTHLTLPIPIGHILKAGALYYAMLLYEAMVIYIVTTAALANYSSYILLVQHVCSQFSVISMRIQRSFENNNFDIEYAWYDSAPRNDHDWIVDIINRYVRTTELVDLINSLSEKVYLIELFLGLLLIILVLLYLFQFSTLIQNKGEALMCSIYVLASMIIIYLNFYVGQRLLDHSGKVFQELCNVPIYRISTRTQKLLLFLLMRTTKPCALSIGGMFVVSHEVFASLMQKAVSYAMVCRTMR